MDRWDTPFGKWVKAFGVGNLCRAMGESGEPVTDTAVHHWIAGRTVPSHRRAEHLIRLSSGVLTYELIYAQHKQVLAGAVV